MKCDEIKLNLPLYGDDILSVEEQEAIELHLPSCPLCRQSTVEFLQIRNEYRQLVVSEMPASLNASIKAALNTELDPRPAITIATESGKNFHDKFMHWLMPYSVGTVAASLFIFAFLFVLMSDLQSSVTVLQTRDNDESPVLLANSNPGMTNENLLLPRQYGGVLLATTPPELNPAGALVALTKSMVGGNMNHEEVVVVADVFGNGLAQIAEVVEAPENDEALLELKKAFETDPMKPPFKPAKLGKNVDRVRIVLKINRVNVANNR